MSMTYCCILSHKFYIIVEIFLCKYLENYSQAVLLCIEKKLFKISIIYLYICSFLITKDLNVKFNIIKNERS